MLPHGFFAPTGFFAWLEDGCGYKTVGLADVGLASGFRREQHSVVVLIDEERIEAFVRHLAMAVDAAPFDFCSLSEGGGIRSGGGRGCWRRSFFRAGTSLASGLLEAIAGKPR